MRQENDIIIDILLENNILHICSFIFLVKIKNGHIVLLYWVAFIGMTHNPI